MRNGVVHGGNWGGTHLTRRIAIITRSTSIPLLNGIASGIMELPQAREGWQFDFFEPREHHLHRLIETGIDGAIALCLCEKETCVLEWLANHSIPTVHAGEVSNADRYHQVIAPNVQIGALGAKHLLELGFRRFAFVGTNEYHSRQRCRGFIEKLANAGFSDTRTFMRVQVRLFRSSQSPLAGFISRLPKPVGIMAANDHTGWIVSRVACSLGIAVPEQLAIVGVDNDEALCSLATPPLSTIAFSGNTVGRHAAVMLEKLMNGEPVPRRLNFQAVRVIERQSTAVVPTKSPEIAAALRFIRQRFREPIDARIAADSVGVSRSTIERGIRELLHCSPFQEIMRLRLDAARDLLATTDTPMKIIAQRCGFTDAKYFSTAFRSAMRMTPTQYRNHQRGYIPTHDGKHDGKLA
jgi:LacI family transcriptional regulator